MNKIEIFEKNKGKWLARLDKLWYDEITEISAIKERMIEKMAANKMKEAVDAALEKTEPVVRKARNVAKSAAKKAEPVLEAAKSAGKQVTAVFVPEIFVQHANRQFDCAELVERCKEDFKAKHPNTMIRSCKLYIKPEDNRVYYVINDMEDKLPL